MMKKLFVLLIVCAAAFPVCAKEAGLKLSLWNQMAWTTPSNNVSVSGLDLGIGSTEDFLKGLQLDVVWAETGELRGVSWAGGLSTSQDMHGAQIAPFTMAEDAYGLQFGGLNVTKNKITGLQVGFFNHAEHLHGFQVGFVNHATVIEGLQFGLINIAENGVLPVMVFINGRFATSY